MNGIRQPEAGEVRGAHRDSEDADHHEGEQQAEGRRRLDPARVLPTLLIGAVLGDVDRRTPVFTAEGQALRQAQDHEDDRREDADLGVGWKDPDKSRRDAHHADGHQERELAPDDVADSAEERGAEGPDREAGPERRQRCQQRRRRIARREELGGEERCQHAVEVEVVPLDDRSGQLKR